MKLIENGIYSTIHNDIFVIKEIRQNTKDVIVYHIKGTTITSNDEVLEYIRTLENNGELYLINKMVLRKRLEEEIDGYLGVLNYEIN